MQAILIKRELVADRIETFWFKPEHHLRYEAGQFIELTIPHDNSDERGIRRWFTLSSSPTDEFLAITTKHATRPSSFKQTLFELKPGDTVQISETMGDFVLPKDKSAPLLFVAGGIGITPVHSMIKWLHDTNEQRTTHLLYAAPSESTFAFSNLFNKYGTTEYLIHSSTPEWMAQTGALTAETVLRASQHYTKPYIFLSGAEEMVEVFVDELKAKGIHPNRLITDYFPGYAGKL